METKVGLPNSCSACGTKLSQNETWFARNEDEARSGQGICAQCMTPNASNGDDLTTIEGVGKSTEEKLNAAGIHTFDELANADVDELSEATGINAVKLQEFVDTLKEQ